MIDLSFLYHCARLGAGVQFDHGAWTPMTSDTSLKKTDREHAQERIQDNVVNTGHGKNVKQVDRRVGTFFSPQPARPAVRINLHQNNRQHTRTPPPPSPGHNNVRINVQTHHNIRHGHNNQARPSPSSSVQLQPSRSFLQSPPQHRSQSRPAPPVHHHSAHNTMRQQKMFSQLQSLEINQDSVDKIQSQEPEKTTSKPVIIEDPIMINFEDLEEEMKKRKSAKVNRSAFIDPADLEDYGDSSDHDNNAGHSSDSGHHDNSEEGHHHDNTTQADDPHDKDKQFCVDISEYLDLKWVLKDSEECHVTFSRFVWFSLLVSFNFTLHISQSMRDKVGECLYRRHRDQV